MKPPSPDHAVLPHDFRNPWTQLKRRVAYENPWIVVYEDQVLRPDGQPGIYGVVHFRNRAVGVVALDEQDRVLLVGQYRYPLDLYSWEIPEGGAPMDEDPLQAAQRELLEETGYSAEKWQVVARAHLSNSVGDEEAICYVATDLRAGTARPDGTEQLRVVWVPFEQAMKMVTSGEITDSLSVISLQRVALMRLGL